MPHRTVQHIDTRRSFIDDLVAVGAAAYGLADYAATQLCYDLRCYKLLKRDGEL